MNAIPPPLEAETLRDRIITREGTTPIPRASLTKCAVRLRDFTEKAMPLNSENAEDVKASGIALKRELQLFSLETEKVALAAEASTAELEHYNTSKSEIEASIVECENEIEILKKKLAHEKLVKKYREEYEALAKIAIEHPARQASEQELEKVRSDIKEMKDKQSKVMSQLDIRKKQFHLLMQSIFDLNYSYTEENSKDVSEEENLKENLKENVKENIIQDTIMQDIEIDTFSTTL